MKDINNSFNVIYLCISEKGPSGGGKIIYRHSEIINKLDNKITSQILHIKKKKTKKWRISINKFFKGLPPKYFGWSVKDIEIKKNFKSEWFKNNVSIRNEFNFNSKRDFVIFPEIFAHFANDLCFKKNISYAIFAQNGYALQPTNDYKSLDNAYKNAKFILTNSKDVTKCIKSAFPFCENKIQEIKYSINKNDFDFSIKKVNLITYMPRKLPEHSSHLLFFLRNHLPKSWKIKAIHNLNQKEVYRYLLKSKIFLAFSRLEGLPLPPVEAAIAGNKVIGYTGEGGKEYWHEPIFTEIQNGDFSKFIIEILKFVKKGKKGKKFNLERKKIIKSFSPKLEVKKMKKILSKISSLL